MRYILLALLLGGCGSAQGSGLMVDSETAQYFELFKIELATRGVNIPIHNLTIVIEDDIGAEGAAALCQTWEYARAPEVHISRRDWNSYNHYAKEALVFHELSHCILGRGHTDEFVVNKVSTNRTHYSFGCGTKTYLYNVNGVNYMPISLMHPCATAATVLYSRGDELTNPELREYYIDELIDNRVVGYNSNF